MRTVQLTHENREYMVSFRENGLVTVHMKTKIGWRILSGYGRNGDHQKLTVQIIDIASRG